jgi:hypothetical protein
MEMDFKWLVGLSNATIILLIFIFFDQKQQGKPLLYRNFIKRQTTNCKLYTQAYEGHGEN